jgi:hypothetical protein
MPANFIQGKVRMLDTGSENDKQFMIVTFSRDFLKTVQVLRAQFSQNS